MKKIMSYLLVLIMTGNIYSVRYMPQLHAETDLTIVESIDFIEADTIAVGLSNPAESVSFDIFTIAKPPKIVIDFVDTELGVSEKNIPGETDGIIIRVRSAQHKSEPQKITRVVLDLDHMTGFKSTSDGNKLLISLTGTAAAAKDSEKPEDETVYDEYENAGFPDEETDTFGEGESDFQPEFEARAGAGLTEEKNIIETLSSQPVTLDFNQADLKDVFRILSAKSGINIIYGDDVQGELTVHLEQVPFREAFKTILSLKNLVAQQVGNNILRIITPEALTTQRSKSVTFWRVFPLNYANADEASAQISAIRSAQGRKGTIQVDSRTNSLIVADSPEGLDDIARLIKEIDIKPQQVLIESRFVEVALENQMNLGIDWGYYSFKQSAQDKFTEIGEATVEKGIDVVGGTADRLTPSAAGTGVLAAIPGQIGGFSFTKVDGTRAILAHIAALAREGKAKFLSNPKITTLNNQEARIWIGSQLPIRTTTRSATDSYSSVVYKMVGIELTVTPTINVDKHITLKVRPEVSLPDTANITPEGDVPINTRYAETTVLIKNNETLVIGGFIEESKTEGIDKVPLLGDIPILGQFFRSNTNRKSRRELLVFITPKIIED